MRVIANVNARRAAPWTAAQDAILSDAALATARAEIAGWQGYAPTPLVALDALAAEAGLASIHVKDEGPRFGLGSFKALGGAYAVARVLGRIAEAALGQPVPLAQITGGAHPDLVAPVTVCCATDGNHGRSVAWGAQRFGCRAVIFIHETVSEGRRAAIARYGAEVRRTAGDYDESVRIAEQTARAEGWHVVSDTSWEGYREVPRDVMQGYELMAHEAFEALPEPPTHIFVQCGVGGMAAAVAALAKRRWGAARPLVVLVDPDGAACWAESFAAGQPRPANGPVETLQAGLACGEVSALAWEILSDHADWALTIPDTLATTTMRRLAFGQPPLVAGESAVAGLAACLAADATTRAALDLGPGSHVLVFSTEGDTDPELYHEIIGLSADEVRRGGRRET